MTAPACSRLQLLPIFRRVLESSWGLASPHCGTKHHCDDDYNDNHEEIAQIDSMKMKLITMRAKRMDLNPNLNSWFWILTPWQQRMDPPGTSWSISPPPSLGKVLFRKAQSHRNSRDILHLQKSTAFQLGPVSLRVGVCQTAVAAALRSTLLTEVFLAISW